MNIDIGDFEKIKTKGEEVYKSISEIYCPYLGKTISFNTQGIEHLKFKRREKTRSIQDQYMRFKLIHLAPEVLKNSKTVQGILETKKFERTRVNSRTDTILKPVNYFEFIAVIKRNRIKVIVKQIDNGNFFFWSLIPFWGMNEDTMTRILHDGIPEED
ncbi:MAG: hypothetical protein WCX27_01575 [Candidatus Paceibacterota bacterium]|jgi:hypothetical protein